MKKRVICVILIASMIASCSGLCFAVDEGNTRIYEEIEMISNDMMDMSEDGVISESDQKDVVQEYSKEAVNMYNQIAEEEAMEIIEDYPAMLIEKNTECNNTDVFNLDCGAQLEIKISVEDVEDIAEDDGRNILAFIGEFICPASYAEEMSQSFGTKKFTVDTRVIAGGTVTLTMNVWVNSSSDGLEITKVTRHSNSSIYGQDILTKKLIEKATACAVGSKCKAKAGVKYYWEYTLFTVGDFGHSKKKWLMARCTYTIKRINRTSVTYYFDFSDWIDKTWEE